MHWLKKEKRPFRNIAGMIDQGFYFDYDVEESRQKQVKTLAGVFPLFFNIATDDAGKAGCAYY